MATSIVLNSIMEEKGFELLPHTSHADEKWECLQEIARCTITCIFQALLYAKDESFWVDMTQSVLPHFCPVPCKITPNCVGQPVMRHAYLPANRTAHCRSRLHYWPHLYTTKISTENCGTAFTPAQL